MRDRTEVRTPRAGESLPVEVAKRQYVEELQTLIEYIPISICTLDTEGNITYVNKGFEEIFGHSRDEVLGKNWFRLGILPDQDLKRLAKRMETRTKGRPSHHLEVQLKRNEGEPIWVEMEARLIKRLGRPAGFRLVARDIAERKRAEAKMHSAHTKLRATFDAIQDNMNVVDLDFNLVDVNDALVKVFGLPDRESILGRKCFEVLKGRKDACPNCAVAEAYQTKAPAYRTSNYEDEVSTGGRSFEIFAYPIMDEDGKLSGAVEFARDITARRQAEEALRELNEKYQQIIDNTWDTIFHIDLEGKFTFGNKAAERLTGYPVDRLLRMNMRELIAPEYQSFVFRRLKERIAGQPLPQPFDVEIVHKDAHRVVVELTTTAIHDKNGKLVGVQGIARNITERKRADESLKESEERYRGLFENSTEGVFAVDLAGNYASVNKAMEELTGYSREELIGRSYREFVSPQTAEFVFGEYNKLFRTAEPIHNIVYERVNKDGKRGWLEGYANVIKKEGKVVGFQGTLRDITERRRVEQALQESEEKLRAQYKGIPVPTYTWQRVGEDLILVDYNDAAADITQGHVASFLGKKDSEMHQDRADILEDISRCLAEKTSIYREMLYEFISTGETKHLAVSYAFVPPDLVLVHTEDITERKRAEEEIRKLTQYLKSVIDNANVLLDVTDPEGNILVWNKAAEVITGYSRDEVVGHNKVWKWLYPEKEYRRAITAKAGAVVEGRIVEDMETTIRTKRGEDRHSHGTQETC
jgi:PAS domain S-box-containing protein